MHLQHSYYHVPSCEAGFDLLESKTWKGFFFQFKDWAKEKAQLLADYGLQPDAKDKLPTNW